jgi:hypothetical protein
MERRSPTRRFDKMKPLPKADKLVGQASSLSSWFGKKLQHDRLAACPTTFRKGLNLQAHAGSETGAP